jgi:hypothetical protein
VAADPDKDTELRGVDKEGFAPERFEKPGTTDGMPDFEKMTGLGKHKTIDNEFRFLGISSGTKCAKCGFVYRFPVLQRGQLGGNPHVPCPKCGFVSGMATCAVCGEVCFQNKRGTKSFCRAHDDSELP